MPGLLPPVPPPPIQSPRLIRERDPADDTKKWFLGQNEGRGPLGNPITTDNEVEVFIEYRDYFRDLAKTISSLTADHFVYFCDWQLILDTWMDLPDGSRKTFKDIIEAASRDHGVQIRALLYQGQSLNDPVHNAPMADWINRLPTGGAILDRRYLNFGSHHQKMVVCLSSDGLVGYCGGMDIAEDRQWRDGGPRPPKTGEPAAWHDVQLRLRGPAAYQLWRTFNARWIDHPLSRIDLGIVNQCAARRYGTKVQFAPGPQCGSLESPCLGISAR